MGGKTARKIAQLDVAIEQVDEIEGLVKRAFNIALNEFLDKSTETAGEVAELLQRVLSRLEDIQGNLKWAQAVLSQE